MLSKIKKNYFLLISTFLILYFFFNLLDGERGLFSYFKKKEILLNLTKEEADLRNKIKDNYNKGAAYELLDEKDDIGTFFVRLYRMIKAIYKTKLYYDN